MKTRSLFPRPGPASQPHEAALLGVAADLIAAATEWRDGATAVLGQPRAFLRAPQQHFAVLDAHARRIGMEAARPSQQPTTFEE